MCGECIGATGITKSKSETQKRVSQSIVNRVVEDFDGCCTMKCMEKRKYI